jgi:molecular chaperone GrpE (heat shock protein)
MSLNTISFIVSAAILILIMLIAKRRIIKKEIKRREDHIKDAHKAIDILGDTIAKECNEDRKTRLIVTKESLLDAVKDMETATAISRRVLNTSARSFEATSKQFNAALERVMDIAKESKARDASYRGRIYGRKQTKNGGKVK